MELEFERLKGSWYVVLDKWEGEQEDLLMVAGADRFLELVSDGYNKVKFQIETDEPTDSGNFLRLERTKICQPIDKDGIGGGADYKIIGMDFIFWLCDVTKFVFNEKFPERIWMRVIGRSSLRKVKRIQRGLLAQIFGRKDNYLPEDLDDDEDEDDEEEEELFDDLVHQDWKEKKYGECDEEDFHKHDDDEEDDLI